MQQFPSWREPPLDSRMPRNQQDIQEAPPQINRAVNNSWREKKRTRSLEEVLHPLNCQEVIRGAAWKSLAIRIPVSRSTAVTCMEGGGLFSAISAFEWSMLQQKPLTHTPVSNTNKPIGLPICSSFYHRSLSLWVKQIFVHYQSRKSVRQHETRQKPMQV